MIYIKQVRCSTKLLAVSRAQHVTGTKFFGGCTEGKRRAAVTLFSVLHTGVGLRRRRGGRAVSDAGLDCHACGVGVRGTGKRAAVGSRFVVTAFGNVASDGFDGCGWNECG